MICEIAERKFDVPRTSKCFRYFGGMADQVEGFVPPVVFELATLLFDGPARS